jgi:DNA polymerase elongation subunit (family B)
MLQLPTEVNEWVLDIETLGIYAGTYPVVSIGVMSINDENDKHFWTLPKVSELGDLNTRETDVLLAFCDWVNEKKGLKFIGYNSNQFDLPFLKRRWFKYSIPCPTIAYTVDLCNILEKSFGLRYHKRLSDWCNEAGLIRPSQFFGADVPRLYLEGQMEEIMKHNEDDLKVTAFLYKRCREVRLI